MNYTRWITKTERERGPFTGVACLLFVLLIGLIDYLADSRFLFTVLYVLPIGFATVYVHRIYAFLLAIFSVLISTCGDLLGSGLSPTVVVLWNDFIAFSLFFIVIYLLDALRQTVQGLEAIVAERTQALRVEMEERGRLERQTLDLTERERQMFGHELHDVVCQELASIAIAAGLLVKKLQSQSLPEAESARHIAGMIDQALTKSRNLARGFFTDGFDVVGLAEALRETARGAEERSGIQCVVDCQEDLNIANEDVVMHFFRIAQEAIVNALKHSNASRIEVSLHQINNSVQLVVEDNGKGGASSKPNAGLELRIMAYRAGIIGGELKIVSPDKVGTRIMCWIPLSKISQTRSLNRTGRIIASNPPHEITQ